METMQIDVAVQSCDNTTICYFYTDDCSHMVGNGKICNSRERMIQLQREAIFWSLVSFPCLLFLKKVSCIVTMLKLLQGAIDSFQDRKLNNGCRCSNFCSLLLSNLIARV
mmetsp:Transcript_21829/g.33162  ORF Transcript_21829/g.33162 Transcript_21829/m.33162 type:complete len:110 (+) Transcript_21829:1184-1513(+)